MQSYVETYSTGKTPAQVSRTEQVFLLPQWGPVAASVFEINYSSSRSEVCTDLRTAVWTGNFAINNPGAKQTL